MFEDLLRVNENEIWDYFFVFEGQFPSDDQLSEYDAIIVTGSRYDSFADEPWIVKLKETLKGAHERKQRILGICFGHQLMAIALGGKAGRSPQGWELGTVNLTLNPAFFQTCFTKGIPNTEQSVPIIEVHQDSVLELPTEANVLASSPNIPYEMFSVGEHILCMQGHPEFSVDFTEVLLRKKAGYGVPQEFAESGLIALKSNLPNKEFLQQLCRLFVHGETS
eukprot:TRINITY_DN9794_c0_g1_i14.p2 TRINITY_DN9794_c0_g1~~TRINITY_DN9794_c0_g1_i14.p2  ORF type:complete len:244 (-),score=40.46 TRINITY_DN9794_c0_g1_i14:1012-1677(-)